MLLTSGYKKLNQMQIQIPGQNIPNHKQYDVLQEQPYDNMVQESPNNEEKQQLQAKDIQQYKSFKQLLLVVLNIGLSSFYFGYILAYLSSVDFSTIMRKYSIEMRQQLAQGLLIGCMPIGGGIGALSSSFLIERYSRRHCLLIVNCIAFLSGLLLFVPHMETLLMARIIQGMCSGFYSSLAPSIMKQLSPRQISGTLTSCNQIMIASGIFFAFSFSLIVQKMFDDPTSEETWWIVFGFSLFIIAFQSYVLVKVYNFETPKYLFLKSRDQQGKQLIKLLYKEQFVESVIKEIKSDIGRVESQQKNDIGGQIVVQNNDFNDVATAKSPSTPRAAVIIAIHLAALQQFCGINAIMAYGGEIVGQDAPGLKLALPIFINAEQVIASIFTSYLLTKIGRKQMFQYGCIGAAVTCLIVALGFYIKAEYQGLGLALIIIGLILFMADFGLTLGPVVWVYLPEIVQADIMPYATGVNWGTAAFIMLLFPVIKQNLPNKNPSILFVFFAMWCILSYFFNKKYLIETKGKTQKQIIEDYRKQSAFC